MRWLPPKWPTFGRLTRRFRRGQARRIDQLATLSIVAVGVASVLLAAVAGCNRGGSTGASEADEIVIGVSFQELNNPYFVVMKESLVEAADSIGAEIYFSDAHHDVTQQVSDVEDLIQKDIDILLINPTDSVGVEGAVTQAKEAGVVVVAFDAQAEGPIDSFVGSKNYEAGRLAGEYLGEHLEGKGQVAILDGIPVVPILKRVEGFQDAIAEFPGIEIVARQNGKQERGVALSVTENMIESHENLDGIFSVNDGGALGALAAIEASEKKIALVSVDGLPEAVSAIEKGGAFIATTAQFPRDQVRIALGIALAKYWGADVPETIPVDVKLITKKNAAGFSW